QPLGRLQHAFDVPGARCASGGVGPSRRASAAAQQGCQTRGDGRLDKLRADEMYVRVDATGRDDQILACDDLGSGTDDQFRIDARLNERIASLADADDATGADAHVAFHDAPVIEDDRVGNDEIQWRLFRLARQRRLALAVADHLAAAELDFLAINGVVLFDLDD